MDHTEHTQQPSLTPEASENNAQATPQSAPPQKEEAQTVEAPAAAVTYNVLQILPSLQQGGVERGSVEMANFLLSQGWGSFVASAGGTMVDHFKDGVHHTTLPLKSKNPWHMYQNIQALANLIRSNKIDIVHARSRAPAWSAYFACLKTRTPFVTTFHGTYGAGNALKRLYNSIMLKGARVISISDFITEHIEKTYERHPPIRKAARGVDFSEFVVDSTMQERARRLKKAWGAKEDTPVILLPGRITRWKGQEVFIEALAHLKDLSWHAVMIGSADKRQEKYLQSLHALIERHGLQERVHFAGGINTMADAYCAGDIVVSASSRPEAFGRVAIESQAMGKVTVATAHGGALETVRDMDTGFLVQPNNPESMAKILRYLLDNKEDWPQIGKKAQQFVQEHFTMEKMCTAEWCTYKEILE